MNAIERAWLSLTGLSVGDAFGERFFGPPEEMLRQISRRVLPDAPWAYTDDTEMALSIVEVLSERSSIDQDLLARRFADRLQPDRGYGPGTLAMLRGVKEGGDWRELNRGGFRGIGSFGNGAAMRAAHASGDFEQTLWRTVNALGDRDTTCAIVGGIVVLRSGHDGIPLHWIESREALAITPRDAL